MTTTPDPLPPGEHQADPVRDLTTLEHIELENLRLAVLNEQERRERIATGPARLADDARALVACGADPDTLRGAVEDALTEQP